MLNEAMQKLGKRLLNIFGIKSLYGIILKQVKYSNVKVCSFFWHSVYICAREKTIGIFLSTSN